MPAGSGYSVYCGLTQPMFFRTTLHSDMLGLCFYYDTQKHASATAERQCYIHAACWLAGCSIKRSAAPHCVAGRRNLELLTDCFDVVGDNACVGIGTIVYGVSIVGRLSGAQCIAVLPKHIRRDTGCIESGSLPWSLVCTLVGARSKFLQNTRLSYCCAGGPVSGNPTATPAQSLSP